MAVSLLLLAVLLLPYVLTPLYAVVEPVSTLMLWRRLTGAAGRAHLRAAVAGCRRRLHAGRAHRRGWPLLRAITASILPRSATRIEEADDLEDMRGGSTITQQLAKNLFLWPARSYVRKALEFPLALWIDLVLSKRRILEIYLNVAEWGPDGVVRRRGGQPPRLRQAGPRAVALRGGAAGGDPAQSDAARARASRGPACGGSPGFMWPRAPRVAAGSRLRA